VSSDAFDPRFRMRRRNFPRMRPRSAPHGFVDGICWFSRSVLWIDGWTSLEPAKTLKIDLSVDGVSVGHEATCIVGPVVRREKAMAVRPWLLLVAMEEELTTASRIDSITLRTRAGEFQWLGGFDRLIAPDVLHRSVDFYPELLEGLEAYVEKALQEDLIEPDDPVLRRNVALVSGWIEPGHAAALQSPVDVDRVTVLGNPVAAPEASVVIPLLILPDYLEHHFPQLERSTGIDTREVILVVGSDAQSPGLSRRLKDLVDLYRVPVKVLWLNGPARWAEAIEIGTHHAAADHLVLLDGHTIGFRADGISALLEPLRRDRAVGITAPLVEHFDSNIRSAGLRVRLGQGGDPTISLSSAPIGDAEDLAEVEIDACSSDACALRRDLFASLAGFAKVFIRPDFETVDLSLRARTAGFSIVRVPTLFTRFVETAAPPPLPIPIPPDEWDLFLLERRRHLFPGGRSSAVSVPPGGRPRASVVIPTLNPGSELEEVLDRLDSQQGCLPFEVLVIDSSSRDGTIRRLAKRGVRHIVIDRKDFNHGLTRNLGLREARGEIVVFLSQDALPEEGWLAALLEAFRDPDVAGAYSRQVPRPNANPFVKDQLAHWYASETEPRRQEITGLTRFASLPLEDKLATVCFDNVSSAVRRSVALQVPFRKLPFGEDRDWAYRVLACGHSIRYCPDSVVIHSHGRSVWYQMRRTFIDHRLLLELLARGRRLTPPPLLASIGAELSRLLDVSAKAPSAWQRFRCRLSAPPRALAGAGGAYLAMRSVPESTSGSRFWRWVNRRMTRGV
jgi:rhamnosyltransferase